MTAPLADAPEKAAVAWELLNGDVEMDIIPREQADLRVRFRDAEDDVLWSGVYDRAFWESRTNKGEIGNKLAEHSPYATETIKAELEGVWTELNENSDHYEEALVSPSVEQLVDNVQKVEVHGGEDTEYHVYVRAKPFGEYDNGVVADGGVDVRRLTFSNPEWVKANGDSQTPPLVEKYANAFYETLDISWSEWRDDIRPALQDRQVIVTDDHMTTVERIAMSVIRSLRHRLDAHADASNVINDTWNGWFEPDSPHGPVVWVPGDTLVEALDKHDKGDEYLAALSRTLRSEGYTAAGRKQTTIDGDPINLYPFSPETLGVEDIDVIGLDADEDDGDGGDGGDGKAKQDGGDDRDDDDGDDPGGPSAGNDHDGGSGDAPSATGENDPDDGSAVEDGRHAPEDPDGAENAAARTSRFDSTDDVDTTDENPSPAATNLDAYDTDEDRSDDAAHSEPDIAASTPPDGPEPPTTEPADLDPDIDADQGEPSNGDGSVSGGEATTGNGAPGELLATVVETVDQLDTDDAGVREVDVVVELTQNRGCGPPDAIGEAIERGVRRGQLYRPEEELIALRPGGTSGQPPGFDQLPLDDEGVPDP